MSAPSRRSPWLVVAGLLGATGIALGAFGTHALRGKLPPAVFSPWETAVHYQLVHALALLVLGAYASSSGRSVALPAGLFTAGISLFAGSLYLLVGLGWSGAGLAAPLGGTLLIAGWLSLLRKGTDP